MKHEKTFDLGKINIRKFWGNKSNRKLSRCAVTVCLDDTEPTQIVFTATGKVWDDGYMTPLLWGQCLEELSQTPEMQTNDTFQEIYDLWRKYHLNNMHAGTPEQETALREAVANDAVPSLSPMYLTEQLRYLKSIGMDIVTDPDGTEHRFGHGWVYNNHKYASIPDDDLTRIKNLMQ